MAQPNRLINQSSPYLLQHAHNPVDWYPWGPEAFEKAQTENKVVFLSVGYATCHWCHVMERESFEDPQVAAFLNQHFVPIKVDREELPDVDQIYMGALQAISGSGGWPMNMFLLPDLRPFFGGTYFPPQDRSNLPSFMKVLQAVQRTWLEQRTDVLESANQLSQHLQKQLAPKPGTLVPAIHPRSLEYLGRAFDANHGGFGGAPKFPQSPTLLYLLSLAWKGHGQAWEMLEHTLVRMAEGGIYDHVGGGFHRYAVDAIWQLPHFEKMLYDNALLARVYLGAYQLSPNPLFLRVVRQTLDWVLQEMTHPNGGFYSAQDADSEGEEGKFYVWSRQEVEQALGPDAQAACVLWGVTQEGNWEGVNILEARYPAEALRNQLELDPQAFADWREVMRQTLYAKRKQRIAPITDDKVLTDWNGLMVRALAEAGRILGESRYLQAAEKNAQFVLNHLLHQGLLRHAWRNGQHRNEAYLSDQAAFGLGLLELYQATGQEHYAQQAHTLGAAIVQHFADPQGGFFDSAGQHLPLMPKDTYDGAYPSGNSLAAELLVRLGQLFVSPALSQAAYGAMEYFAGTLGRNPMALPGLLNAYLLYSEGSELAVPDSFIPQLNEQVRGLYLPLTTIATGGNLPLLQGRLAGKAYLCREGACRLPVDNLSDLQQELAALYPAVE